MLEIDSLEEDLDGLHERRVALEPVRRRRLHATLWLALLTPRAIFIPSAWCCQVLRHRAAVAANRGSALNTVADQLEDIDGAIEVRDSHRNRSGRSGNDEADVGGNCGIDRESWGCLG